MGSKHNQNASFAYLTIPTTSPSRVYCQRSQWSDNEIAFKAQKTTRLLPQTRVDKYSSSTHLKRKSAQIEPEFMHIWEGSGWMRTPYLFKSIFSGLGNLDLFGRVRSWCLIEGDIRGEEAKSRWIDAKTSGEYPYWD